MALDVFRDIPYHKDSSELTGWLLFLTTESLKDAEKLIEKYPWLEEIYREIASYREKPEEVLNMFSDALKELDRNTMQYMIEEQQKAIEAREKTIEAKEKTIEEKEREIKRLRQLLEQENV